VQFAGRLSAHAAGGRSLWTAGGVSRHRARGVAIAATAAAASGCGASLRVSRSRWTAEARCASRCSRSPRPAPRPVMIRFCEDSPARDYDERGQKSSPRRATMCELIERGVRACSAEIAAGEAGSMHPISRRPCRRVRCVKSPAEGVVAVRPSVYMRACAHREAIGEVPGRVFCRRSGVLPAPPEAHQLLCRDEIVYAISR